jgi:hypothetical protein
MGKEIVGKNWFTAFLKWKRNTSLKTPVGISKARVEGMNRKFVAQFFGLVKKLHKIYQFKKVLRNCLT